MLRLLVVALVPGAPVPDSIVSVGRDWLFDVTALHDHEIEYINSLEIS